MITWDPRTLCSSNYYYIQYNIFAVYLAIFSFVATSNINNTCMKRSIQANENYSKHELRNYSNVIIASLYQKKEEKWEYTVWYDLEIFVIQWGSWHSFNLSDVVPLIRVCCIHEIVSKTFCFNTRYGFIV